MPFPPNSLIINQPTLGATNSLQLWSLQYNCVNKELMKNTLFYDVTGKKLSYESYILLLTMEMFAWIRNEDKLSAWRPS